MELYILVGLGGITLLNFLFRQTILKLTGRIEWKVDQATMFMRAMEDRIKTIEKESK